MIQPRKYRLSHRFAHVTRLGRVVSGLQRHGAIAFAFVLPALLCTALGNAAHAEDATLPAPSNLEDAKSDVLQLDRSLAHLKQRLLLPNRSLVLFGLTPKSQLTVQSVQVSLDGAPLPVRQYDKDALNALLAGGMDTVMDTNLKTGNHTFDVTVTQANKSPISQRIQFTKTVKKDILGIQLVEHPGPGELPLRLVEWSQHD
jgi:hypothetical protein